jgi:hypothetical protein
MRAFSERRQVWLDSAEGAEWTLGAVEYALRIAPDGTFRVDSVPPGEYTLRIGLASTGTPGPEKLISRPVTIAPGSDSATIDLGEIQFGN